MKTRLLSLFATLLLLGAGAMAQSVVLNYKNGDIIGVDVSLLENVTFEEADNHEFVDLELPSGTLWAMMNVGANTPEDYGDYFAWGETETKASFYYENYKWMNEGKSSWDQINKYTFEDNQTGGCWYSDWFVCRRWHNGTDKKRRCRNKELGQQMADADPRAVRGTDKSFLHDNGV